MEEKIRLEKEETVSAAAAAAAAAAGDIQALVDADEIGKGESNHNSSPLRREPSFSRWCDENGVLRSSAPAGDGSPESNTADEDSEEFELPLLRQGDVAGSEAESQTRFHEFPQKSMFWDTANGGATKYVPLDIENGVHASESITKLESLEQCGQRTISVALVLRTLFYILVWYTFSICLTLYNKILLGNQFGRFPAPLLMNTVHFSMQAILSNTILYIQSRLSENSKNTMTWKDYFFRVVPTAIGTALDVNLSNESLVFISVTFATMCKSASPIFLLMFAFAFRLEKLSFKLIGIILVISFGILLTVAKETEFEIWGFIFVMLSSVMSGFRWCMTQILLQKESYGLKNPVALMSYVTPVMAVLTAFLSLVLDPWHKFKGSNYFDNSKHIIQSCLLMLLGGALAFLMVLTEYILVSATSAVTVTVAGIVKEAVTILVAVLIFHDQFTWLKAAGLLTIILGVSLFNWYKGMVTSAYDNLAMIMEHLDQKQQRYDKLQSCQQTENEGTNFRSPANYVILDDMELQNDDELEFSSL